jgi:hypothetical protein
MFYIGYIFLGETLLKKCSPPNPLPKTSNIELGRGAKAPFPSSGSKVFGESLRDTFFKKGLSK